MIKTKRSLMMIITILLSMVFVVNLGYTFAAVDYNLNVISDNTKEVYNYLNDVVVNNSTTLIPIPYTEGTVSREIGFDYSFSETTDYAVTYTMKYVDNSGNVITTTDDDGKVINLPVKNVQINIADRDNYLLDTPNVDSSWSVAQYDNLSGDGTLYYMGTLVGNGNQKVINSVTFVTINNEVAEYVATSEVTLYSTSHNVGDSYTSSEFEYIKGDIERYWEVVDYTNGTSVITAEEYNALFEGARLEYSPNTYQTSQSYTFGGETISSTSSSASEYLTYINKIYDYYTISSYECLQDVTIDSINYTAGSTVTVATYEGFDSAYKAYFAPIYQCTTAYTVVGANTETLSVGTTIQAEAFAKLHLWEQNYFKPQSYVDYKDHNLVIEVKVYTKVNSSATGVDASEYYTTSHYFGQYSKSNDDVIFNTWINFKKNTDTNGDATPSSQELMIYNPHGTVDSGIPYAYDYSANDTLTSISRTSNITTSYIYRDGNFYLLAGGNKSHAGLGVYYLTHEPASISVSVGASWYDANGDQLSAFEATISNVELGYNSSFTDADNNNYYDYNKKLSANSYGYIDILEYIRINTITGVVGQTSRIGNTLVITSVTAELVNSSSETAHSTSSLKTVNSTKYNPSLISSVLLSSGTTVNLDTNISIVNNTNDPMKVSSIVLTPKFYAYNGQTSASTLKTNEVYMNFNSANGTKFVYNTSTWSMSSSTTTSDSGDTIYQYEFSSNGIYIAPHSSLTLIEGIEINGTDIASKDWTFALTTGGEEYIADYWFEIETSDISATTATTSSSTTTDYELMTILTSNDITAGTTTYVAMRNNTSQIMTSVSFSATLKNENNYTISYNYYDYLTSISTAKSGSISISKTGVDLLPGESLILCKIVAGSSTESFGISSYTLSGTLGGEPSYSSTYLKRDFASGNLSVVNGTSTDRTLTVALSQIGGSSLTAPGTLNGGTDKWSYDSTSTVFTYDGKVRAGQMLNIVSGYTDANLTATLGTVA